jgi:hypothetical protein
MNRVVFMSGSADPTRGSRQSLYRRLIGEPLAAAQAPRAAEIPRSGGRSPRLPRWLQDPSLSDRETTAYREAARCLGLEVGHWARQVLNNAAQSALAAPARVPPRTTLGLPGPKRVPL